MKLKIKGYPIARAQFSHEKESFYDKKDFTILEVLK